MNACRDTQIYLLSDLMPLHLQHLLLLIGVIDDVLSTNQQLALHRLTKQQRTWIVFYDEESEFPVSAVLPFKNVPQKNQPTLLIGHI